jgi:hypothetical protein
MALPSAGWASSDKFSFTMDLAFRFLPTFSRDFVDNRGRAARPRL